MQVRALLALCFVLLLAAADAAAVVVPRNSIGSPQVKPNSLKGIDINERTLGPVPLSLNAAALQGKAASEFQLRVHGVCPAGQAIFALNVDGSVQCLPVSGPVAWSDLTGVPADLADGDDDTTYDAGLGLELFGTTFAVDFGSGMDQVARGNHDHDGAYLAIDGTAANSDQLGGQPAPFYTNASNLANGTVPDARLSANVARRDELSVPGTLNDAGNPVDWTKLKGVPGGFADGVDDAGAGPPGWQLTGNAGTTEANFLGTTDGQPLAVRTGNVNRLVIGLGTIDFLGTVDANSNVITNIGSPNTDFVAGGGLNLEGNLVLNSALESRGTVTLGDSLGDSIRSSGPFTVRPPSNPPATSDLFSVENAGSTDLFTVDSDGAARVFGGVATGSGTVAAPAYSFRPDQNTGIFHSGTNELSIAAGGVSQLTVGATGVTLPGGFVCTACVDAVDLAFDPATQAELDALATPGTINAGSNPVDWTKLKSVPAGFADGTDSVNDRAAAPSANTVTTLDTPGSHKPGATVGSDGLGLIAYGGGGDLHVAHCENPSCSSATTRTLATPAVDGGHAAVTIGADGFGLIADHDFTNKALRVTHCENLACSSSTSASFDAGFADGHMSITIGTDGFGLISYWRGVPNMMKIAHCENVACSVATPMTLDPGVTGGDNSIAIGADGLGLISYRTGSGLKVAHCQNTACSSVTGAIVDAAFQGNGNSLTIGDDGLGLISYTASTGGASNGWRVAHCQNVECSSVTATTFDPGVSVGETSVTIGADRLGVIAYRDFAFNVKVAHCQNPACSAVTATTVLSGGFSTFPALTLGADGLPLIAFAGGPTNNDQLKVAHCSNAFCVPYFRRR